MRDDTRIMDVNYLFKKKYLWHWLRCWIFFTIKFYFWHFECRGLTFIELNWNIFVIKWLSDLITTCYGFRCEHSFCLSWNNSDVKYISCLPVILWLNNYTEIITKRLIFSANQICFLCLFKQVYLGVVLKTFFGYTCIKI